MEVRVENEVGGRWCWCGVTVSTCVANCGNVFGTGSVLFWLNACVTSERRKGVDILDWDRGIELAFWPRATHVP